LKQCLAYDPDLHARIPVTHCLFEVADAKPQEKGIDVALAIDFVSMAVAGEYEVGVLMSTDTDLKPALEAVARITPTHGVRAEVASWSSAAGHSRRLSISSRRLYCHWLGKDVYGQIVGTTNYS
jgi:uncharacterized LabA/DUF88 family protein